MRNAPRWTIIAAALGCVLAACAAIATAAEPAQKCGAAPAGCTLGCRVYCYGKFQAVAWEHMASIGLRNIFIAVPPLAEVDAVKAKLAQYKLKAPVMRGEAKLSTPEGYKEMEPQLQAAQKLGTRYIFLSPKHPGATKEEACDRLRCAGELAKKYGIILSLETHPDLGTNGDEHVATMKRINHPNVRVNFDTGNISFYNKGINAVDELKKVLPYLATMEIKDHNGEFMTWNFPALGKGVIDIPGVLKVLAEHKFAGPITMEVEGVQGSPWTEAQTKQNIADSVKYMRSLGTFD